MSLTGRLLKLGVAHWQQAAASVRPTGEEAAGGTGFDEAAWGEELFQEITATAHHETSGWATETVARVQARLSPVRPAGSTPLEVVVVWLEALTAFTAPGSYIYFSRRLLERCRDDEAVAFVVAHETAHHASGTLPTSAAGWSACRRCPAGVGWRWRWRRVWASGCSMGPSKRPPRIAGRWNFVWPRDLTARGACGHSTCWKNTR